MELGRGEGLLVRGGTFCKRQGNEWLKTGYEKPVHSRLVRERGFEPLRFNPLDPKCENQEFAGP